MKPVPVIWLLLPVLAVVATFFAALLRFLNDSFLRQIPGTAMNTGPRSLINYTETLQSPLAWLAMKNTLEISAIVTVVVTLIGYPLAYLMARAPTARMRNTILFVLIVTFLSGGITRAYAWMLILGNNGPINRSLRSMGFDTIQMINNKTGVIISLIHFVVPFFVLTLLGAMKNIPPALEEAARNNGASRWRAFTAVTLPLSMPGLFSAIMLSFTVTLSSFLFPLLLGGGRVEMAANLIYDKMQSSFDLPAAAAMSLLFLAFSLIPIMAFSLLRSLMGRRFGGVRR